MTREEAIGVLKHEMYEQWEYPLRAEALDMAIKSLSAQSEPYEDKLKEIADALSEKMCYMNTCPNERDIILGYLGYKHSSKNHCNTDCWNEKCESYHYETKQLPEPCNDAVSKIKDASFIGSDGLDYVETLVALDALKLTNSSSAQPEQVCVANITLTDEQVKEAVEKAKNAVISVIEPEQRWIPVSERLPEDEYVLISKKPSKLSGSRWCVDIAIRMEDPRSRKIQWRDSGFSVIQDDKVLAWQPLPEPYKEEGDK